MPNNEQKNEENFWISYADLMAGLLFVFILVLGTIVIKYVYTQNNLEKEKNLNINVASIISEGLFKQQSKEYQESIIPRGKLVFGLTAGLPVNLEGLIGDSGKIIGLEHFGYSAPASVLDQKFGFTSENVCQEILKYIQDSK